MGESPDEMPAEFACAVASLTGEQTRSDVRVAQIRPPRNLAPWAFALEADVTQAGSEAATGRLVLLHDTAGYEAWDGTLRLVMYASAAIETEMALDPLLPEVGWSWLTDALAEHDARYTAIGGTVTQTSSTKFGEVASAAQAVDIELRASWTPLDHELGNHLRAWVELLCTAAGVPPPGVAILSQHRPRGGG